MKYLAVNNYETDKRTGEHVLYIGKKQSIGAVSEKLRQSNSQDKNLCINLP